MEQQQIKLQTPFLKWVGGKQQLIQQIIDKLPNKMQNYHEIFLGGGAVLFTILSLQLQGKIFIEKKIYAYDLNQNLINTYKQVQTNYQQIYEHLQQLYNTYYSIELNKIENEKKNNQTENFKSREIYYYFLRNKFNQLNNDTPEFAALFIFLNKTCYRGIYREGPNGFNVPFGNYKNPKIISQQELQHISQLIKDVTFITSDFSISIMNVKEGLDPPYAPETSTSFVKYTNDGFSIEQHTKLFQYINNMNENDIKILLSNSNVKLVKDSFKNNFKTQQIEAKRAINQKNPGFITTEVLIYN